MTVATTHAENKFTGDGVQTVFTFTFQVVKTAPNLVVLKSNVVQVGTYTTAINADQEASPGGTVTFSVAPANGAEVIVRRVNPQTQSTDFPLEAKLSTASVEAALDKAFLCLQEVSRDILSKAFFWRGDWSSTTAYSIGDAVSYAGASYIAVAANTNSTPPSANWNLVASAGSIGPSGPAGYAYSISSQSSASFSAAIDYLYKCDTTSNAITANLVTAVGNAGRRIAFVKMASANTLTLDGSGSESVNGALTLSMTAQYECVVLVSDGANWLVESRVGLSSFLTGSLTYGANKMLIADGSKYIELAAPSVTGQIPYWNGSAIAWSSVPGFESTQQTITAAGSLVLAHGLGAKPSQCWMNLVCVTGEGGYTAGDVILNVSLTVIVAGGMYGASVVPDATNLNIRYGSSAPTILHKTTGSNFAITATNWKAVFCARL